MPIIKSAKKALRQNSSRRSRNLSRLKAMKQAIRNISRDTLPKAYALIDKAVKNNLIHKNKAARLKSKVAKLASSVTLVQKDKPTKTRASKK